MNECYECFIDFVAIKQLFDDKASQGKVSSDTSKESTIQQAAEVALKLFLKSKGEDSGGLLSLASKFLK